MPIARLLPPWSLKSRITIATLVFIMVTALALTGVSSLVVHAGMERIIGAQQTVLTAHIAENIDHKLSVRQNVLKQLASEIPVHARGNARALREFLNRHHNLSPLFDNLTLLDRHGQMVFSMNHPESTLDASQRKYFIEIMRTRKSMISAPLMSKLSNRPILLMLQPLLDRQGAVELILLGVIHIEQDYFLGDLTQLKIGKAGYSFLTSADGTYVVHTNKNYILKNALDLPGDNSPLKRILAGETAPFLAVNRDGVKGIFTSQRLHTTSWTITTFLPADEAFEPVKAIAYNALYLALLLMLIMGPLAWWYTRRQIAPLQTLRERIQRGDREQAAAAAAYSNDEIGDLARAYDKLIAEKLLSRQALTLEKERLSVTLQSIADAVITTDTEGLITYMNPVAEHMTGWPFADAAGQPLRAVFDIINESDREIAYDPVTAVLSPGPITGLAQHTILRQRGGLRFAIEDSAAPILNADNNIIGIVLVFHDVTEAQKLAIKMSHRATHDALTGLINRHEFEHRLKLALDSAKERNEQHTLLYLDLDRFKIVNDTCGHEAGDELLRQLTMLLQARLRKSDTLARLGGDEFGVLLEGSPTQPAEKIANALRKTVRDFNFTWNNKIFPIGMSIGLVPIDSRSTTLHNVLAMADAACYIAKGKGRDQVHVYSSQDSELLSGYRDAGWTERIRQALDQNRLTLFAQKIVALERPDGEAVQYELLLRMEDSDGQLLAPMAFIPAAERFGLMPEIDRWVISAALAGVVRADDTGAPIYSINLSGATICDETFLPFLRAAFARCDVPPARICFEISEANAITHLSKAILLMHELKAIGCQLALDDFHSGVSAFASIRQLPIDYLKLDGTVIKEILEDPVRAAMLAAVRHVSRVIGNKLIAEQVENVALLEQLRLIGVDYAQGCAIEAPRPWRPGQ
jgi:diguanylate cyclase (GGDEF)-like protein/PAS domain S-box-containing protein